MGLFKSNGTRITKATFPTTAIPAASLPKVVSEDITETVSYGGNDPRPEGSIKTVGIKAGAVLTQQEIDNLFPDGIVSLVSPAKGPAAGSTTVTIEGEFLDGATLVKFGANNGTTLKVVSPRKLTVKTPAGTAGKVAVAVTTDAGVTTVANAYTYE